jgi:hypothetical protein
VHARRVEAFCRATRRKTDSEVCALGVRRGNYEGPEPPRLATLKFAALKGAPYVDVEYKAAPLFFASE